MNRPKHRSWSKRSAAWMVIATALAGCQSPRQEFTTKSSLLTQAGEAHLISFRGGVANTYRAQVYYPIPYSSPPHLEFPEAEHGYLFDLKQTAEGFDVFSWDNRAGERTLRWHAQGIAAQRSAQGVPVQPDGAANGSQPIRSETNRTSSAAGSRR